MTLTTVGLLGILGLLLLIFVRIPVAFSMAGIGVLGFSYLVSPSAAIAMLSMDIFETLSSYNLTVIPMFVFMGSIAFRIGITASLFDASYSVFGRIRGSLAMASVIACAGFSAICGSTNATAAAMGAVALPQMKRYKYDNALATGCVASAGTLGILIPPSALLIIYGIIAEQSIGSLFLAGIIPGVLLAFLFVITILLLCSMNPALAPAGSPTSLSNKVRAIFSVVEIPVIFLLIIGGLSTGWFSPTQAGGAGSASLIILGLLKKKLTWKHFVEAGNDTLLISCMVVFIVMGAIVFNHFIAVTKIPFLLADWINNLSFPPAIVMGLIVLVHLIGGCFMDGFALILLTVPILLPLVEGLGYDLIWFGIMIVLIVEMGAITPPVGVNVYVIKGISADVPLETIFRGIFPFLVALVLEVGLLICFPQLTSILSNLMAY
jgi:C4-dicarboxylate transporter DctM subunit